MEEIWKEISGYDGRYKISNKGHVTSFRFKGKLLTPQKLKDGYIGVTLQRSDTSKNLISIHRLVAMTFIPNPENKPHVNHINGVKTDNRVENLEWVTPKENIHHSIKNGFQKTSGNRKLNDNDALIIRDAIKEGFSLAQICGYFKIEKTIAYNIKRNKTYTGGRKINL